MSQNNVRVAAFKGMALMLLVLASACSSSSGTGATGGAGGKGGSGGATASGGTGDGGATPSGGTTGVGGDTGPQVVGVTGGSVVQAGVTLSIPVGALAAPTTITVATTTAPAGYVLASAAYQFGPPGTTFTQPVTVTIPLTSADPSVHLFWSNATGGFDDLGGMVNGTTLTGQVSHFSVGFAAKPKNDGGPDGGVVDGAADTGAAIDAVGDKANGPDAPANEAGGDAGGGGGAGGDAGTTVDAAADGAAAAGTTGTDGGATDAPAADASTLCNVIAFNAPTLTPTIVNDGSSAPAGSSYTGGPLVTGRHFLTGVTHYGATYVGETQAIWDIDAVAKTIKIAERIAGTTYQLGLTYTNADAHTLHGTVACGTLPNAPATIDWVYTLGVKLTVSQVGSPDVKVLSVPAVP